jgi:energy-coupling factor transporter ATP-binding protein EcfA2
VKPPRHPSHQFIAFVGAPGTGKSTLAQALNVQLKLENYDSEFAPEYARAYLRRSGPMLSPLEQFIVYAGATKREDELRVHQFVVADSASCMGAVYYQYERATNPGLVHTPEAELKMETALHELRRLCRARIKRVDHLFLVHPGDFETGDDPTREYMQHQDELGRRIEAYLYDNDADFYTIKAKNLGQRLQEVLDVLSKKGAFEDDRPHKAELPQDWLDGTIADN